MDLPAIHVSSFATARLWSSPCLALSGFSVSHWSARAYRGCSAGGDGRQYVGLLLALSLGHLLPSSLQSGRDVAPSSSSPARCASSLKDCLQSSPSSNKGSPPSAPL